MRYKVKARPIPPKVLLAVAALIGLFIVGWIGWNSRQSPPAVHDFDSCVAAGGVILLTYPEQCSYQGSSYFRPGEAPPKPY